MQRRARIVENYPFGDEAAVFKVARKMFALVTLGPAPGSVRQPGQRARAELPTLGRPKTTMPRISTARITRFRRSLSMGRLSRSVTRAECPAGADDRCVGDGGTRGPQRQGLGGTPGRGAQLLALEQAE